MIKGPVTTMPCGACVTLFVSLVSRIAFAASTLANRYLVPPVVICSEGLVPAWLPMLLSAALVIVSVASSTSSALPHFARGPWPWIGGRVWRRRRPVLVAGGRVGGGREFAVPGGWPPVVPGGWAACPGGGGGPGPADMMAHAAGVARRPPHPAA